MESEPKVSSPKTQYYGEYLHAEATVQALKRQLCDLQQALSKVRPHIDRDCLKNAENIFLTTVRLLRRCIVDNNFDGKTIIMSAVEGSNLPFASWENELQQLQKVLTSDQILDYSKSSRVWKPLISIDAIPLESQTELSKKLNLLDAPADLKYVAYATNDERWLRIAQYWRRSPLSLRWATLTLGGDLKWLAYTELYQSSPVDLRWIAINFQDPQWLHLHRRWKYIPLDVKRKAIECGDIRLISGLHAPGKNYDATNSCSAGICAGTPNTSSVSNVSFYHDRRFESQNDYYLLPVALRSQYAATKLSNRCVACPIHCSSGEDRLDLHEFRMIRDVLKGMINELIKSLTKEGEGGERPQIIRQSDSANELVKVELKQIMEDRNRLATENKTLLAKIVEYQDASQKLKGQLEDLNIQFKREYDIYQINLKSCSSDCDQLKKQLEERPKVETRTEVVQAISDGKLEQLQKEIDRVLQQNHQQIMEQQSVISLLRQEIEFLRSQEVQYQPKADVVTAVPIIQLPPKVESAPIVSSQNKEPIKVKENTKLKVNEQPLPEVKPVPPQVKDVPVSGNAKDLPERDKKEEKQVSVLKSEDDSLTKKTSLPPKAKPPAPPPKPAVVKAPAKDLNPSLKLELNKRLTVEDMKSLTQSASSSYMKEITEKAVGSTLGAFKSALAKSKAEISPQRSSGT